MTAQTAPPDLWDNRALTRWLADAALAPCGTFSQDSVANLPPPARRFLTSAITEGTPLWRGMRIEMDGEMRLSRDAGFMPMRATQIMVPPLGMIWDVTAGRGIMRIRGQDAITPDTSWSLFKLWGLIPVARAGGTEDHYRASFGRLAADSLFWLPTAYVPGAGVDVSWSAPAPQTARMSLRAMDHEQAVDLIFADAKARHPSECEFQRWSDANDAKQFRLQPFGGTLSDWRDFDGLTLPTRIEAGNNWGQPEGIVFFRARVVAAHPF